MSSYKDAISATMITCMTSLKDSAINNIPGTAPAQLVSGHPTSFLKLLKRLGHIAVGVDMFTCEECRCVWKNRDDFMGMLVRWGSCANPHSLVHNENNVHTAAAAVTKANMRAVAECSTKLRPSCSTVS